MGVVVLRDRRNKKLSYCCDSRSYCMQYFKSVSPCVYVFERPLARLLINMQMNINEFFLLRTGLRPLILVLVVVLNDFLTTLLTRVYQFPGVEVSKLAYNYSHPHRCSQRGPAPNWTGKNFTTILAV